MPRPSDHDDWEDDGPSWDEDGEEDDYTVPCPWCKRPIHEDAERCPYCGHYISDEDKPPQRKPWWMIVGALVCLYLVYRWVLG